LLGTYYLCIGAEEIHDQHQAYSSLRCKSLWPVAKKNLLEYEAMGLILPLKVGEDRFYTTKDFLRIKIIEKGKKLGFSLQEIKQIIEARV
jgi:DNA-binding transcriptional MerR regulator